MIIPNLPGLTPTEKIILQIINEPKITMQEKVHLVCHYRAIIENEVFKFFLDQIKFVEDLKEVLQLELNLG